jgi:hypothetical protein
MSDLGACGLAQDVDYPTLQDKVMTLLNKYEGERRKKISIEWSRDKIIEHRLFEQLDGLTPVRGTHRLHMSDRLTSIRSPPGCLHVSHSGFN